MNKYIIYTPEGYCEDPNGNDVCNCQVLGKVEAIDKKAAVKKLFEEQSWIEEDGFSPDEVYVSRLHDNETI